MNLVIDLGNTRTKLAFFQKGELIAHEELDGDLELIPEHLLQQYQPESAILCSVVHHAPSLVKQLSSLPFFLVFNHESPIPIENNYASPETLGLDRLANACAAANHSPGENCLIIDAGTCLKFDFVDAEGKYKGGAISPGLHMRYEALNTFTDKLPLIGGPTETPLIGTTTETSIRSGVANGILKEIEGITHTYQQCYPNLKVFLTGGDSEAVAKALMSGKNSIFADNFLTLRGLHAILQYQLR